MKHLVLAAIELALVLYACAFIGEERYNEQE